MMNARKKQTNRNNVSMCPFCGEFYPIGRSMSTHIRHCEQEQRNEEAVINNVNNGPRSPTTFTQLKNSFMEELRSDAHDIINGSYDLRQDTTLLQRGVLGNNSVENLFYEGFDFLSSQESENYNSDHGEEDSNSSDDEDDEDSNYDENYSEELQNLFFSMDIEGNVEVEDEINDSFDLLQGSFFTPVVEEDSGLPSIIGTGPGLPFNEKNRYKHGVETHSVFKFSVELESIIRSSDGSSLCMFSKITECISKHAKLGVVFSFMKLPTRLQLLNQIIDTYNLHNMKHSVAEVTTGGRTIHMPITQIADRLQSMLSDTRIMKPSNFSKGLNILTGLATDDSYYDICGAPYTGKMWRKARSSDSDPEVMVVGFSIFYDGTHIDLHGKCQTAPLIAFPYFWEDHCFFDPECYIVLGFTPNLALFRGKAKSKRIPASVKRKEEHDCLKMVTKQFTDINNAGGQWCYISSHDVWKRVKVEIIAMLGDCKGHNEMTNTYPCHPKSKCGFRSCLCPPAKLNETRLVQQPAHVSHLFIMSYSMSLKTHLPR